MNIHPRVPHVFGPAHGKWKGGMTQHSKGYMMYTAHPYRNKLVHRVIADECMMESYGRHIRDDEEVHHLCGTRSCSADFHLVIMPEIMHHSISNSNAIRAKKAKKLLEQSKKFSGRKIQGREKNAA